MENAMKLNNAGGQESWILDALENHSTEVWQAGGGGVHIAIYQVQKEWREGQYAGKQAQWSRKLSGNGANACAVVSRLMLYRTTAALPSATAVAGRAVMLRAATTLVGRNRTTSSPGTPFRLPNSSARSGPM